MSRSHAEHLATDFGDQVEAARHDNKVFVGRALAGVCQCCQATGVLVGNTTMATHRVGHDARRHRARRVRRTTMELGEAESNEWLDHVVYVATAQHAEHAAPGTLDVKRAVQRCDEGLHARGIVCPVNHNHWLSRDEFHSTRHPCLRERRRHDFVAKTSTKKRFGRDDGRRGVDPLVDTVQRDEDLFVLLKRRA